jgi:hypothetical protein
MELFQEKEYAALWLMNIKNVSMWGGKELFYCKD